MNIKEEYNNNDNDNDKSDIIRNKIFQKEIKNTNEENLSNKSHKNQRPREIFSKYDKSHSLNVFKGNESGISLETFKTMFKNKNKELKEYKESLDRKIELLRNKINSKNIIKGRNRKNNNLSTDDKFLDSTLKDNNINNSHNKKNYGDSLLFTLRGGINYNPLKLKNNTSIINFNENTLNNNIIYFDLFYK